ncbi:hypothetical protein AB0L32_09265 [Micrococcus luteus]|uniref:hypothetical protein n=1 Tax=Bacillati TaxID=1783272 RepID=UPI0030BD45DF
MSEQNEFYWDIICGVKNEIEFALETDESSKIVKTIGSNKRKESYLLTREELLEETLIRAKRELEKIRPSDLNINSYTFEEGLK